ncbi:cytochrome P450 [archaeon]|nr:MAG: cytochrome P450 [archaeon]
MLDCLNFLCFYTNLLTSLPLLSFSAHTFLAFGAGITYCPGRKFARNELKLLVVYLLHRLNLKLADPQCDTPGLNATRAGIGIFPPVQDVNVDITLRQ